MGRAPRLDRGQAPAGVMQERAGAARDARSRQVSAAARAAAARGKNGSGARGRLAGGLAWRRCAAVGRRIPGAPCGDRRIRRDMSAGTREGHPKRIRDGLACHHGRTDRGNGEAEPVREADEAGRQCT